MKSIGEGKEEYRGWKGRVEGKERKSIEEGKVKYRGRKGRV